MHRLRELCLRTVVNPLDNAATGTDIEDLGFPDGESDQTEGSQDYSRLYFGLVPRENLIVAYLPHQSIGQMHACQCHKDKNAII